jgi:outer membrane protein TolC
MRGADSNLHRWILIPTYLLAANVCLLFGCALPRWKHRVEADQEVRQVIAERNLDPRWANDKTGIEIDPRSRYFDRGNPDCGPMPQDDPDSNHYMRCVDGKQGWAHWYDNGIRQYLENPQWKTMLGEYVDLTETGAVKLDLDSAITLAYIHSPDHQNQLETLYLSALDVTRERFRLDTQLFGNYDATYDHDGSLNPASIGFDSTLDRYVVGGPFDGNESNRVTLGGNIGNPSLQARRRLATAGEILIGFANSFIFEFTGPDVSLSSSLINFSIMQPLLRGAGRDIALEALTQDERDLLANLRAYGQFRQGFFTRMAIGESGVAGPQRGFRSTSLQVFSGQGAVGGYVGLLRQLQQIRNSEDNLSLQLRTLSQLEAILEAGLIDLVQVDQFRQSVESEKAGLLQQRNSFQTALDQYKTNNLGLPPDLEIELDDSLIRQFQIVDPKATALQDEITSLQDILGGLSSEFDVDELREVHSQISGLLDPLERQFNTIKKDIAATKKAFPKREKAMGSDQVESFREEMKILDKGFADVESEYREIRARVDELKAVLEESDLKEEDKSKTRTAAVILLRYTLRLVQKSILVQARARLEQVTIEDIELESELAFQIALSNRLDFMNGRAALVDSWRQIHIAADALQSVLNFNASGDVRTAGNNPLNFRAPTSNLRVGVEFDAPFTRLVERNAYREALINYQRSRRDFIQSRDRLHLDLRNLIRELEQQKVNLEIQRRSVAIAIRRVDLTREALYAPVAPPRPGQRGASFGPTAAINLLSAQSALRDTQNRFLNVWLSYYAAKMRLTRELGIMTLDPDGKWDETLPVDFEAQPVFNEPANDDLLEVEFEDNELPPPLPVEVDELSDELIQLLPPSQFINEANLTEPDVFLR